MGAIIFVAIIILLAIAVSMGNDKGSSSEVSLRRRR